MTGDQTDLFDLIKVDENAGPWWRELARQAIEAHARGMKPFSADVLHEDGLPLPDNPARWGAAFHAAHKAGIIRPCGYVPSRRAGRNGSVIRLWEGIQ